ncbi:MAG TPA: response regulator [Candidatus Polarisedimenticolia bacterium]|nr:response regulator [Candidatus Polarisedimenticolia bacterium]
MSRTILIADDSQAVRDILQVSLETLGYRVVLAEDGERAMERIQTAHPDLIIADVMMPKVNGFQICRRVKSDPATHRTPVILLTARSGQEDVFWGKDCGADEYITKPFKTQDLEETINRLLQDPASASIVPDGATQPAAPQGGQIVMLRWDPRALDVFRKKYGEIRFSAGMQTLRAAAAGFMAARGQKGPVAVHVPVGLSAVVAGDAKSAQAFGRELAKCLDAAAEELYEGDDRALGYIRFRDPRTGREEQLPLLAFTAGIDPDTHV